MPFIFTVAHYNLPIIPFPCPHIRCHGLVPCTRRPTCYDKKHIGNHREGISHSECLVFSVCGWLDFCRQGNSPDMGLLALASVLSKPLLSQSITSVFAYRWWSLQIKHGPLHICCTPTSNLMEVLPGPALVQHPLSTAIKIRWVTFQTACMFSRWFGSLFSSYLAS